MQTMHYYNRSTAASNAGGNSSSGGVGGGSGVACMPTPAVDCRQTVPVSSYHGYAMSPTPDAFHNHHHHQHHQNHHHHHQQEHSSTSAQQQCTTNPAPPTLTRGHSVYHQNIHPHHHHEHQQQLHHHQQSAMHRSGDNDTPRPQSAFDREQHYAAAASPAPGAAYGYPHQHQHHQQQHQSHHQHHIGHTAAQQTAYGTGDASYVSNQIADAGNRHAQSAYLHQQQQQQHSATSPYDAGSSNGDGTGGGGITTRSGSANVFNQYNTNGGAGAFGQQLHQTAASHAYDISGGSNGSDSGSMMYPHHHHHHQYHQRRLHHPPPNSHMYTNTAAFGGPNPQQPQQMHHQHTRPGHPPTQSNDPTAMPSRAGVLSGCGGNGPEYPSDGVPSYAYAPPPPPPTTPPPQPPQPPPPPPPAPSNGHHFHQQQQRVSHPSPFHAQHPSTESGQHTPCTPPVVAVAATATLVATTDPAPSLATRDTYGADETVAVHAQHSSTSLAIQSPPPTEPPPPPPPPLLAIDAMPAAALRSGPGSVADDASTVGDVVCGGNVVGLSDHGGARQQQQPHHASNASTVSNGVSAYPDESVSAGGAARPAAALAIMSVGGGCAAVEGGSGCGVAAAAAAKHDGSIAARSAEVMSNYPTPPPSAMPPFHHHHATEHYPHHPFHDAYTETKYRRTQPSGGREKNLSKMAAMNRKLESDTFYGSASPMYEMERAWSAAQAQHHQHQQHAHRHLANRPYMMESAMYYQHQQQHQFHPYHYPHHYYGHGNSHARYGPAYMRSQLQMHPHMPSATWAQLGGRGQHEWGGGSHHHGQGMATGSAYATAAFRRQQQMQHLQQLQPTIRQAASPAPLEAAVRRPTHGRVGRPPARELYCRPYSGVFESDVIPSKKKRKAKVTDADKEQPLPRIQIEAKSVTPLPGFLQAFGSTEIGRFSEMFFTAPDSPTVEQHLQQEQFAFGLDFETDTLSPLPPFGLDTGDMLEASSFYVPSGSSSVHSTNAESYTSTGSPASSSGYFGDVRGVEY